VAERPGARRARLLVLGAGPAQLGLLEAAAERADIETIAADRDPQAPGFDLADERAVVSSEDEEAVERLARARGVHGLISPGADWTVGVAARVAERLELPHPIDAATAAVAVSKARQRERLRAAGVPQPRLHGPDETELPFPCVVKAPDRQGQLGLSLVRAPDELPAALERARAESRAGGVLVEELVEGPEITVNGVWLEGSFVPLTVTDRRTAAAPAFGVALAHVWPSAHATPEAVSVAAAAARAVGIRNGPSYVQVRLGPDGPRVMEIAARLGGGHDAELCEAALGVDLNGLALGFALGRAVAETAMSQGQTPGHGPFGGACVRFLVAPEGVLLQVDGVEDALAIDGVRWVRIYRRPGWRFGPLRRGADRAGAILAVGTSPEDALERADRAAQAVRFQVDVDRT
jgi:biotin carboxylase